MASSETMVSLMKNEIVSPAEARIALFMTEGSSDKEYHVHLRRASETDDAWVVDFQNGRRGKALRSGTKTLSPVSFEAAKKIYDSLVKEKMKGGYTPDVSGAVFQGTVQGEQFSGCLPQLPTVIRDADQIESMMKDSAWWVQEKHDGDNRQVRILADSSVEGINKRGLVVALPQELADAIACVPAPFLASGELVGSTLYLFDVQEVGGKDLRAKPYSERYVALENVVKQMRTLSDSVVLVTAVSSEEDKRRLVNEIGGRAGEGVVFKRADAPFVEGKLSTTNATQFKWKFTEDCTVRVKKISKSKRSVEMEIDGPEGVLPLGSVSIPVNYDIPNPGDLISVSYLHLFEGGSLFQPQYKGVRTDCEGPDTLDQFKIKAKAPAPKMRA